MYQSGVYYNWGERERAHPCRLKARFFYIRSRVIPQSSFYASFLISTHARQCPAGQTYAYIVCVCLIDEEAHRVFGSRRRGRGATVEATCHEAPGKNAALRTPPSRGRRYCRDNELGNCQRVTERRVTETATEREARLARRRVQDRARRASESLKQRDARLQ